MNHKTGKTQDLLLQSFLDAVTCIKFLINQCELYARFKDMPECVPRLRAVILMMYSKFSNTKFVFCRGLVSVATFQGRRNPCRIGVGKQVCKVIQPSETTIVELVAQKTSLVVW